MEIHILKNKIRKELGRKTLIERLESEQSN